MDMTLPNWERANCIGADPESFFPLITLDSNLQAAKRVCASCDIKFECAEWAIRHESDGLWGGLMPKDRQRIRSERNIVLEQPHHVITQPHHKQDAA
jgi:WhiB family redox-sensing transcriptional regulator